MNKTIDAHAMDVIQFLNERFKNQADVAHVLAVALGMIGAGGHANKDQFTEVLAFAEAMYHQCQQLMKEGIN